MGKGGGLKLAWMKTERECPAFEKRFVLSLHFMAIPHVIVIVVQDATSPLLSLYWGTWDLRSFVCVVEPIVRAGAVQNPSTSGPQHGSVSSHTKIFPHRKAKK